jgi:ABC-2 type transport system ATP-binding protein
VLGFDPSSDQASLGIATASSYPGLAGTRRALVRLAGPPQVAVSPAGGAPASISVFPGLGPLGPAGLTFDMPGQSAAFTSAPLSSPIQLTGSPMVRIRVSGASEVTLFAKIYDVDQAGNATLPNQLVSPVRITGAQAGRVVTIALPAIDYDFSAGHRIRLALTTTDYAYATSASSAVYRVALAGPGVTMPEDPALTVVTGGVPWWVWAVPAAALVAAALILALGRRRGRGDFVPELADVPLEITGLTKRFRDGQLAVDDLSLRVERGQILGVLGPNGAGKTTTLRALMGLVLPQAGTITIFGRRVHPGSPALSRLGSFVEGPGFLPHLSGRDNLDLYWRATGRPADGAHLAEVLEVAGLGAAIDRKVRAYSRGMRQRLAIAQAMLGLPDLLVLDEPMNGLDPPQIREMRDVLLDYAAAGRTVILSSHLLGEIEQTCTHVVVMQPSAVVAALVGAGVPVERVGPSRRLEDAFLALIATPGNGDGPTGGGPAPPAGDLAVSQGGAP